MAITALQVKELRERTGAGLMECKKALVASDGDIEASIVLLRTSGQTKAAKKAGRIAAEGIVVIEISDDGKRVAMVEINCETDFVARDKNFLQFADMVAKQALALQAADAAALLESKPEQSNENGKTIEEIRQELMVKIGENINIRRCKTIVADAGVNIYQHGTRIGVLVVLDNANLNVGKDIAMHIAASNPQIVSADQVPQDIIDQEQAIYAAQAAKSGKSAAIVERIIAGKLKKFTNDISLLGQPFVKDSSLTVEQYLANAKINIKSFARFAVGEGIEKKPVDFAKEVMAQAHRA